VPRIQIKLNTIKSIFKENHTHDGNRFNPIIGNQPLMKSITINVDINKILAYSAKKNKTNPTAEYSTLYPETNSDSASGKSKGILLVSANAEIKNRINDGKKGIKYITVF
jgi:hypothetical protein